MYLVCANFNCTTFKSITKYCRPKSMVQLLVVKSRCELAKQKQKFSCLLRFVFFCYTSLKFHSTAVTHYMHAPLYRKISHRLLVAKPHCEQGEASKKYCILWFKTTKQNKKNSCLGGLNLFVLSLVKNFFISACSCECAKQNI